MYSCGLNQYGQLGLGDTAQATSPEDKVKFLLHHVAALDGLAITDVRLPYSYTRHS